MNPSSSPFIALMAASDEDLARHATQDHAAFAELYHRYFQRVYRLLFAITSNIDDAQNLTTQTFLTALESIHTYRAESSLGAWLFGIARNKAGTPEAHPAIEVKRMVNNIQPDPIFEAALEWKLMEKAKQKEKEAQRRNNIGKPLAWAALVIGLLIGMIWTLSQLLPRQAQPDATLEVFEATASPTTAQPAGLSELTSTSTPSSSPIITADPEGTIYSLSVQPEVDYYLQAEFPAAAGDLNLYRQLPWEALTVNSAHSTAADLGVIGDVYLWPYVSPGSTAYLVWDGQRRVTFFNSQRTFEYQSNHPALLERPNCQAPCFAPGTENSLPIFLSEHGLLDISFIIRPSDSQPQALDMTQTLEAIPIQSALGSGQSSALIGSQGELLQLEYHPIKTEIVGRFPILTAQEAWESAGDYRSANGVLYFRHPPARPGFGNWLRIYPLNKSVEVFGNLQVFQPAEPGGTALALLDGFPLSGNAQGMAEAAANTPFVQVWGLFKEDENSVRRLEVQGWQRSAFPSQKLSGRIERRLGEAFLLTENQVLHLPDVPIDAPEGAALVVNGVVIEQPELTLAWSSIAIDVGGEARGGADFSALNLAGDSAPPASPIPAPSQPALTGQRLDGVQGRPQIFIHQYSDGSSEVEVEFHPDPGQVTSDPSAIILEGPGLAGIEAFNNLPIRIWGEFSDPQSNLQVAVVERVEPVYPGQTLQAWLGRFEPVALEGKDVLLFTDSAGQQYVLGFSLDGDSDRTSFAPGDPVVIEGFIQSDRGFGGYPIISDILINPGQGLSNLDSYLIQSASPLVTQESGTAGAAIKGTITSIELVYYVENTSNSNLPAGSAPPYIQPAWRFSGTYEDGSYFTILIQALKPEYLVHP